MFRTPALSIVCLILAAAAQVNAQVVVLKDKDHTRISGNDIIVGDGRISRNITLSNGMKGQASVSLSDIERLEWPNPQQLVDARKLMAQGKMKEGIDMLLKAREFFKPFKEIKGAPYNEIVFAIVEAQDQSGDFDALIRALPEANAIKWDEDTKLKLRVIKLNLDRRTSSDVESIRNQAESLLTSTDDSNVAARLWMTIAEVHFKKERWAEAFNAFLHVPVFYGNQGALVPQAELMAGKCLAKMERYQDAAVMLERIATAYPGSEAGEAAKKEANSFKGMKNMPDKPKQTSNDSNKKTESKS